MSAELDAELEAAKQRVRDGDHSDEAREALHAAKQAVHQDRAAGRTNPEAPPASADDGVAAPEPVQVTTEGG